MHKKTEMVAGNEGGEKERERRFLCYGSEFKVLVLVFMLLN